MNQFSREQHVQIIKMYYENHSSVRATFRALRQFYGAIGRPAESTIRRLINKFEATGSVNNKPTPTRRRNVRSAANVAAVRDSVRDNPRQSISRRAQELSILETSLRRILHLDLEVHQVAMHPAKPRKRKLNAINEVQEKVTKITPITRLKGDFFNVPCSDLANSLLGKVLVRKLTTGEVLKGRIVETEIYPGGEDKASHSYNGRRTAANEPMYMSAGTTYVYMTYGMYYCFNISSVEPGGAVLIRALQPLEGMEKMMELRKKILKNPNKSIKPHELSNGPSKLCSALSLNKETCNTLDLTTSDCFWVEDDGYSKENDTVINAKRIGIDKVGSEWADKPFRYYLYGNVNVSKRDMKRENQIINSDI